MNIQEFLKGKNVSFDVLPHRETYQAQRMAQAVHVSGHHVAKTVLIRIGEPSEYVVVVLLRVATSISKRQKKCLASSE